MRSGSCGPWVLGCAALLLAGGCPSPTELLNPAFLSSLGGTQPVASLPGDAPALLLRLENRTDRVVEMVVSYRDADDNARSFTVVLLPGPNGETAEALVCPVRELTLGDVSDLTQIGARVRLGIGSPDDAFVEVEPFGVLLRDEANYECGDAVTFTVQPSAATSSGYRTFAFVQRAGASTP